MLAAALADLVASPLTEIQTVEQLQAAPRRKADEAAAAIPPEVQEKLVHEVLDQQLSRLARQTHAHVGRRIAAHGVSHRPRPRKPRRLAQAPGEPLASYQRPQRSHGHLRFHMDVARTKRRTSPQTDPNLAISHSFAVTGLSNRGRNDPPAGRATERRCRRGRGRSVCTRSRVRVQVRPRPNQHRIGA